jgi:hypothetical protein
MKCGQERRRYSPNLLPPVCYLKDRDSVLVADITRHRMSAEYTRQGLTAPFPDSIYPRNSLDTNVSDSFAGLFLMTTAEL